MGRRQAGRDRAYKPELVEGAVKRVRGNEDRINEHVNNNWKMSGNLVRWPSEGPHLISSLSVQHLVAFVCSPGRLTTWIFNNGPFLREMLAFLAQDKNAAHFPGSFFFLMSKGNKMKITNNFVGGGKEWSKMKLGAQTLLAPSGDGGKQLQGRLSKTRGYNLARGVACQGHTWKEPISCRWDSPFTCQLFSNQFTGGGNLNYVLEIHLHFLEIAVHISTNWKVSYNSLYSTIK